MIGLGSNRLTVCRRGGMSVTQAGRGGMEWLAGNGKRRESPYSAQATAALKAQFPTQWPTIRDYGFAHPEIVGYMNAYAPEDAKIAYSLVEGIGHRGLITDGYAYINTKIVAQRDMAFETEYFSMDAATTTDYSIFGARSQSSYFTMQNINGRLRSAVGSSWVWTEKYFENNKRYLLKRINNDVYVDGILINSNTAQYNPNGRETYFFTMNSFATNGPELRNVTFALGYCKVATQLHLVPFKLGVARAASQISTGIAQAKDTLGMMDLLTGIFYPNAHSSGQFTELIESPS